MRSVEIILAGELGKQENGGRFQEQVEESC